MNSNDDSRMQQTSFFDSTPKPGKLIFTLVVPGRLPSLNEILGMEAWGRYRFKKEISDAFLSSLRATAADSSTKIIWSQNTMSIYADTLESCLAMRLAARKSRSLKKKLALKNQSESSSKSTLFDKPKKLPF